MFNVIGLSYAGNVVKIGVKGVGRVLFIGKHFWLCFLSVLFEDLG